jgi:hypothetical protein
MSDEILDELKAIRETLERVFELLSAQVGAEVKAPAEMHFHVNDLSRAVQHWNERQQKTNWGLF